MPVAAAVAFAPPAAAPAATDSGTAVVAAAAGGGGVDACVTLVARGEGTDGSERELGRATIDLCEMLTSGEDKLLVSLSLEDQLGQHAGRVHATLLAQQALRAAWWLRARREHLLLIVHEVRLQPDAVRRAGGGAPLTVWAESDLAGAAQPPLRTAARAVGAGVISLHQRFELHVPAGSAGALRLEHSLRGAAGAPLIVEFCATVDEEHGNETGGGAPVLTLGTAELSLRQLLREGDLSAAVLPVVDPHGGAAGEVVLSVMATEVAATLFGGRSWGPEAISVGVHSVTLEGDLQASPLTSISTVWVEVDLLSDRNPEAAPMKSEVIKREAFETTPSLRLEGAGAMPLSSRWDVSLAEGTPLLAAVRDALASEDEQDSDVYFVLHGADALGGAPRELGSAHINLERLLKRGSDATRERLPILDPKGARVGAVTVSLRALDALTWAKRGADESMVFGVRVGALTLAAAGQARLDGRSTALVEVVMPAGIAPLRSAAARIMGGKADIGFKASAEVAAGSATHGELAAALAAGARDGGDDETVGFVVSAAGRGGGGEAVEVCRAAVGLGDLLREAEAPSAAAAAAGGVRRVLPLPRDARPEPYGTLEVWLDGGRVLRSAHRLAASRHATRRAAPGLPLSLLTAAPKLDALPGARPPLVEIPAIMTAPRPPFGAKSARLEPALRNSAVPVSNVGELENDE